MTGLGLAVAAEIGYWDAASGRPVSYAYEAAPGAPQLAWPSIPRQVTIGDARQLPQSPTLDRVGLALVEQPSEISDFYDEAQVRDRYYPESERLLKQHSGAETVLIFDHTIRARPVGQRRTPREPILRAHVDYTVRSGPQRVRDLLREDEAAPRLARRFAVVNMWRPIGGPVEELPLAVCDGRSVAVQDLVACDMRYENRTGEIYAVGYNPAHAWFYYPGMTPAECLLFKNYDSLEDGSIRFAPHSAFAHPATSPGARVRESIELRCLLFW